MAAGPPPVASAAQSSDDNPANPTGCPITAQINAIGTAAVHAQLTRADPNGIPCICGQCELARKSGWHDDAP
eukprot:gene27987-48350_t